MRSSSPIPGGTGIAAIVAGCVVVSLLITIVTQTWVHWLPLGLALVVSYWAIAAINGR